MSKSQAMSPTLSKALITFERVLNPILSPRQPLEKVERSLQHLDKEGLMLAHHWVEVIAASNVELAYTFSVKVGEAKQQLDQAGLQAWISESLAVYDEEGLYPASEVLKNTAHFARRYQQQAYTVNLEEVKPRLDIIIRGLMGRELSIQAAETAYTDTAHLYLPKKVSVYTDKQQNLILYKVMACFLWAQNSYGTFKTRSYQSDTTERRLASYADERRAERLFLSLENIRLLANIERDLPGLFKEIQALSPLALPKDKTWRSVAGKLRAPGATVEDTFKALDVLIELSLTAPPSPYQGELSLGEVAIAVTQRKEKIEADINALVAETGISQETLSQIVQAANQGTPVEQKKNDSNGDEQGELTDQMATLRALLDSILSDVDEIMMEDLGDDGQEGGQETTSSQGGNTPRNFKQSDFIADDFFDEWDYLRQDYRRNWCRLRIKKIEGLETDFKQQTMGKYPYLSQRIRKVFEAMRDQPSLHNRQTDGQEIDIDAVVELQAAQLTGEELSDRVYIRRQHTQRKVAVCLLVDMSGSTKGWINLAMRESLIIFSQALQTLGDRYAIVGFSGLTRQRCEIYTVKEFAENSDQEIDRRIANISARDYTRMGFAIRYATDILAKEPAKHRILLILSDGKPDDYDGYQGEYGIQDTRKAIMEAQSASIRPFSITIDQQAQAYLPRLFGPGQYTILKDVTSLPLKLSEIYSKLSA